MGIPAGGLVMPKYSPCRLAAVAASLIAAAAPHPGWTDGAGQVEQETDEVQEPSTGVIEGRIAVDGDGRLPRMVVYLESTDPERRFPIPADQPVVSQAGAKFSPPLVVVSVGQTVQFPNDEDRPIQHNVFSKSPSKPFDLGMYRPGRSKSVTFDRPGAVRLHCSIHKKMNGVIYVSPTPFFAIVSSAGDFRIDDVPAGKYVLRTWQERRRYLSSVREVTIAEESTVTVQLELRRK